MHWHHILEQTAGNIAEFGAETIHSAENLIPVSASVHARISGYYSSKQLFTEGKTVRQWLSGQSFRHSENSAFRFFVTSVIK